MNLLEFSQSKFDKYLWNDEKNIIYLLQENDYLKKNSECKPKNWALDLIDEEGNVLNVRRLKREVQEILDDYYTWDEARDKLKWHDNVFEKKLVELGYYDECEENFTKKAFNNWIVTSFGMFTYDGIQSLLEESSDTSINNVALVQWIGPFNVVFNIGNDESLNICENWINRVSESPREFNFYYIEGYESGKGNGAVLKHYIGKTERYCLIDRLKQPGHKINEFRPDSIKIWIGRLSDHKMRSIYSLQEKIEDEYEKEIHNLIENTEWGLIHGFITKNTRKSLLNDKKTGTPKFNVCVVNQWYKPEKDGFKPRTKQNSGSELLPDIILYNEGKTKILDRI